jgi:hypothetical protein
MTRSASAAQGREQRRPQNTRRIDFRHNSPQELRTFNLSPPEYYNQSIFQLCDDEYLF